MQATKSVSSPIKNESNFEIPITAKSVSNTRPGISVGPKENEKIEHSTLAKYLGRTDDNSSVLIDHIRPAEKELKSKYAKMEYYKRLPEPKQKEIKTNCNRINTTEAIAVIGGCTFAGGGAGLIAGGLIGGVPGCIAGGIGGGIGGGCVGVLICMEKDLFSGVSDNQIKLAVKSSKEYQDFRAVQMQKRGGLFGNFFKNYCNKIDVRHVDLIEKYVCNICYDIPIIPVFSPHDKELKHVYDQSEIIAHLENIEIKMQNAKNSGATKAQLEEIAAMSCPFKMGAFTKDELVYDVKYAKNLIKVLEEIYEDVTQSLKDEDDEDPLFEKMGDDLLKEYLTPLKLIIKTSINSYDQVVDGICNDLGNNLCKADISFSKATELCNKFRAELKLQRQEVILLQG